MQGYRSQDSSLPSDYTGVVGPLSVFDANRSDAARPGRRRSASPPTQIGKFNYVAGAFYQHDQTDFCVSQVLGIYDLFGVPTPAGHAAGRLQQQPAGAVQRADREVASPAYGEGN